MNKIAAEEVANILNTWYRAIRRNDAEQSIRIFEEVKPMLAEMGKYTEAEEYLTEAIHTVRKAGDCFKEMQLLHNFALLYAAMDNSEKSIQFLEIVLDDQAYAASDYYFNAVF